MKAKRVIIGALLLLLLFGGAYVYRSGGDVSSLSNAYSSGSGATRGGLGQLANALWMTMVNAELGRVPGSSAGSHQDGIAGGDGSGDPGAAGSTHSDVAEAYGVAGSTQGPDGASPAPAVAPRPSSGFFGVFSSLFSGGQSQVGPGSPGDTGTSSGSAVADASGVEGSRGLDGTSPAPAVAPRPSNGFFGVFSSLFSGGQSQAGPGSSAASGSSVGPAVADGPASDGRPVGDGRGEGAPAPSVAPNPAGSIGGFFSSLFFGGGQAASSGSESVGRAGAESAGAGEAGPYPDDSFESENALAQGGDDSDLAGYGTPAGQAGDGVTEIAQANGNRTGELAMGQQTADTSGAIPRAANFGARLQSREQVLARHQGAMARIGFPLSVEQVRKDDFSSFLRKSHASHSRWYAQRSRLIGEYNRERARDRAEIQRGFRSAQARDRKDGGQAHLRRFMRQSRDFNNRRAAQNNRFQALLDQTGRRVGTRFQYLFQLSLRRHLATQSRTAPDENQWRAHKARALASADTIYADGRAPAASRTVNRGVRNYMRHWIAFFYNKKIEAAKRPEKQAVATEPDAIVETDPVVEKFQPKENCGPTNLHTYSLDRMRTFVKSLESNCRAANGLPDLLLKSCARYHVQMDLKVSCKRDIYFFLKFDSENTYDRNQAIDHFNDGCRPYRSVQDLGQELVDDPNRGIASLQKDRMNRMLEKMRGCSAGGASPAPVRTTPTPKPTRTPAKPESGLGPATQPGAGEAPETPELVPDDPAGKEPESAPEPVEESRPDANDANPDEDEPSAEETLGFPEST